MIMDKIRALLIILMLFCVNGTIDAQKRVKKDQMIDFKVGVVTDSCFFEGMDQAFKLNKYKTDPIVYVHFSKEDDIKRYKKDRSVILYTYLSPAQTVRETLYRDYVVVPYKGKIFLLPPQCNDVFFTVSGNRKMKHDAELYSKDMDVDGFFDKYLYYKQVLQYKDGQFYPVPKDSNEYRDFTE
jgi:hypothetical protein